MRCGISHVTLSARHRHTVQEGLRYLDNSTYWSRICIIQEFVLGREISFRVGYFELSWDEIYVIRPRPAPSWLKRVQQDIGWPMTNILDLRHAGPTEKH
jgi:hypothetical protein